jgi:hypothetical protein
LEAAKLLLGLIQHTAVAAPLTLYGQLVQRGSTSPWAGDEQS